MKIKNPHNEEKHVLIVFAISIFVFICSSKTEIQLLWILMIYFVDGMISYLAKLKFRIHLLVYSGLLFGALYFLTDEWVPITLASLTCCCVGFLVACFVNFFAGLHSESRGNYQNDLAFAKKAKELEEERRYAKMARQLENKQSLKSKETTPVSSPKVIPFKR